jgi:hypothetical protein
MRKKHKNFVAKKHTHTQNFKFIFHSLAYTQTAMKMQIHYANIVGMQEVPKGMRTKTMVGGGKNQQRKNKTRIPKALLQSSALL